MLLFFWRIFLSFLLITAITIATCTTWGFFPAALPELLSTQLPRVLLLLVGEAALAGLASFLLYNPIHKLRLDLSGRKMDQATRKRIEGRSDEIGALATAISKQSVQCDATIDDLMAQQRYLATILENLNDGICIVDDRGIGFDHQPGYQTHVPDPRECRQRTNAHRNHPPSQGTGIMAKMPGKRYAANRPA